MITDGCNGRDLDELIQKYPPPPGERVCQSESEERVCQSVITDGCNGRDLDELIPKYPINPDPPPS